MVAAAANPVQYFEQVWQCCQVHKMILTFGITLAAKFPQQLLDQKSRETIMSFTHCCWHPNTDAV